MSTDDEKDKKKKTDDSVDSAEGEKKITHRVEISRDPEIDSLQQELAKAKADLEASKKLSVDEKKTLEDEKKRIEDELKEKKAILEQQALTQLEKERSDIMELAKKSKLSDEQISDIEKKLEDPKSVGIVRDLITMLSSTTKEVVPPKKPDPSGKAPITPPPSGEGGEGFETKRAMIDELYKRAYYFPQEYTKEQVEDAKKKIETLLRSMIGGKSWKQMQEGERLPTFKIMECPKCRGTIIGEVPEKCPYCKFNFTKTGDR